MNIAPPLPSISAGSRFMGGSPRFHSFSSQSRTAARSKVPKDDWSISANQLTHGDHFRNPDIGKSVHVQRDHLSEVGAAPLFPGVMIDCAGDRGYHVDEAWLVRDLRAETA